jgi:polysaccharide deacetylase family protein (PEP-CTERM system associated)
MLATPKTAMLNVLSVDVEDYFHVEAFASRIKYEQWDSFTPRVERNVKQILDLFAKHGVTATFFVLGWVAKKFPRLVQDIARLGHEIGSHGYRHRRLHILTPDEFRRDVRDAGTVLSDQAQQSIRCYRAPSFSIVKSTMWALDILGEEGISLDSSIFPVRHDLYGYPDAERFPSWYVSNEGHRIFEFPPSTIRCWNQNVGVAGGGYLRLMPYGVTRWAIRQINQVQQQPAMVYFHPWEIDANQPRIRAGCKSSFRHYTNLSTMHGKIERLVQEFRFASLSEVCRLHKSYNAAPPDSQPETGRAAAAVRAAGAR